MSLTPSKPLPTEFLLSEESPSSKSRIASVASCVNAAEGPGKDAGSGSGCSICHVQGRYDPETQQISLMIPREIPLPDELEVTVVVAASQHQQRFQASAAAVNALLHTRQGIWRFPSKLTVTPSRITLDMTYVQKKVRGHGTKDVEMIG